MAAIYSRFRERVEISFFRCCSSRACVYVSASRCLRLGLSAWVVALIVWRLTWDQNS